MRWLLVLLVAAGCAHTKLDHASSTARSGAHVKAQVESRSLAALIVGSLLVAGAMEDLRDPQFELDPDRKVSEQDCSKPIDYTVGNLRCK